MRRKIFVNVIMTLQASLRNKQKVIMITVVIIITIYIQDADIINHMLFIIIKCFSFLACFLLFSIDE